MKEFILKILLLLCVLTIPSCLFAQNVISDTLVYEDNYVIGGTRFLPIDSLVGPLYPRRATVPRGNLQYTISGNIPDSLKVALQEAFDTWNKCMPGASALINIQYASNINSDVETAVRYLTQPSDNTVSYPQSLYRHLYGETNEFTPDDATITINSSTDWYVGISSVMIAKKNLNYAVKRAIAHALGFGSSVKAAKHGYIVFGCKTGHTPSDNLIFNSNNIYLNSITNTGGRRNMPLETYVTSNEGNLFIKEQNSSYGLYAPTTFDACRSLKCLTNSNSIMYYEDNQVLPLNIDNTTMDVLAAIGWNFDTQNDYEIVGENIESTGVASAYSSHRFYLSPDNGSITSRQWECKLPLANGSYQTITANTSDFTLPAVQTPNNYKHTIDGCVAGEITFHGYLNGQEITAEYSVTLRLAPKVLSLNLISVAPSSVNPSNYDVTVGVRYEGAYGLMLSAREKGTSQSFPFYSANPYYAQVTLTNIRLWDDTYVTATASNIYGVGISTITVPAEADVELLDYNPRRNAVASDFTSPRIVGVQLSYDSLDSDLCFVNSKGVITVACQNPDSIVHVSVHWADMYDYEPWSSPFVITQSWPSEFTRSGDRTIDMEVDNIQWWDIYCIGTVYENGQKLLSDTVCIKDVIYLPEEIEQQLEADMKAVSVKTSYADTDIQIEKSSNCLTVSTPGQDARQIQISSLSGILVAKASDTNTIDVSRVVHGVYILSVTTKNGNTINKKVTL